AMAKYPDAFSNFYVNMVRAGEAGGVLEHVLERLGIFLESSQELKDYIKSAMIYPVFLLCVSGLSIIIMMTFVVPRFSVIFSDMGSAVPMSTRFLLWMSEYLKTWWWTIPVLTALIYFGFRQYSMTRSGRMRLDSLKINLILIGTLVKKIEVARFARTLGTLVKSGVPILEALHLTRGIMTNKVVSESLDLVHKRVKEGERLSKPLGESGIFPSLAVQMIMVGEETGRLDEMLLRVADNYEKTVKNLVHRLVSLLEPVLILIMGCVVAFIVISMLLGIFSMNELPL
ncbi:type II secretion system F family protein, partial [Desulfobacterales bacterium HSG16]|nr:type II secretion system F family protein [Desulfobacterales bacterium HSG16]